jgi:hemoglobin-like flavoprotein
MTPEQITLVQSSFERLRPNLAALAHQFYLDLFEREPALRPLFAADLAEQEARFAAKLTEIARSLPHLDVLLAHTRDLGARHAEYGVKVGDYRILGEVLLSTLGAFLGDSFDAAASRAWETGYNLIAESMLEGAALARFGRAGPSGSPATGEPRKAE